MEVGNGKSLYPGLPANNARALPLQSTPTTFVLTDIFDMCKVSYGQVDI